MITQKKELSPFLQKRQKHSPPKQLWHQRWVTEENNRMDQSSSHSIRSNGIRTQLLVAVVLCLSFALTVRAAFHEGYIGPDYTFHMLRIVYGKLFEFSMAD